MLKGEMSLLNVLLLEELDINAIEAELQKKHDEAPQFFTQSPLIVDCYGITEKLMENPTGLDFSILKETLLKTGFIPVGLRNAPASINSKIVESGWALMRSTPKPVELSKQKKDKVTEAKTVTEKVEEKAEENKAKQQELQQDEKLQQQQENKPQPQSQQTETQEKSVAPEQANTPTLKSSMTIERPVRSGQQIYAADADMTVLAATSAGSEIVADGSIHIYGALRGRALAGARGNTDARIFCQSLQGELIAIAGCYLLLDESDTNLKGKPAMIRLEGEKLVIEPLA